MKWKDDEIDFMSVALEEGWTHKEIGNELDRTLDSTKYKARNLGLVSLNNKRIYTNEYISRVPKDIIVLSDYINANTKILHKHSCGFKWLVKPSHILSGHSCPECSGKRKKTIIEYKKQVPKDIKVLDNYINSVTKILHKHSCGFEWLAKPNSILSGKGCPKCQATFNPANPAVTYLIYFQDFDLYKFGISNNYINRFKQFGSKSEIIFIREFTLGSEARELESQWSKSLEHLKINTGLLTSGNTETFKYKA